MIGDDDHAIDQWIRHKVRPTSTTSTAAPSSNTADLKQGDRGATPPRGQQATGDQWIRAISAAKRRIVTDELEHEMNRTMEAQ